MGRFVGGASLQDAAGAAIADWSEDTFNTSGQCETLDSDPWQAVPAVASLVGHTAGSGTGTVDLVWGLRPEATQQKGVYEAGVSFDALAP